MKLSFFIKFIYSFIEEAQKLKLVRYNKTMQNNLDLSIINYKLFSGKNVIYEPKGIGKEYNGFDDKLRFEGEYKNGQRNGKGKEYGRGSLEFEGKYKNGKRNGKGKEYFMGPLIFEGEYLNDKEWIGTGYDLEGNVNYKLDNNINGYRKEYDENHRLIFEGEFLNGKRNGKGKEYDCLNELIFEGEYLNGKRNGKGKEYGNRELIFEGEYLYVFRLKGKEN